MTAITIKKNESFRIADVVRRSPVKDIPDAEKILRSCVYRSIEVRTGFVDDEIACMWGLIPPTLLSNRAWLWLLTTDIVDAHKFLFVRHSQRYVEEALREYPFIDGNVAVGNHSARRWLKWLGAEFGNVENGFIPFTITAKVLNG